MTTKKPIAVDTSSMIAYLQGAKGDDVERIEQELENCNIILPPVVLSELLSDAKLPKKVVDSLQLLPMMEIKKGYWQRVGEARAKVLSKKLKARLADSLIAQICVDHKISLITRDRDFKNFAKYCDLKLI